MLDKSVQFAKASVAASQTDSSVVAAVPGRKIRVVGLVVNHGDTTASTVTFGSNSTAITPALKGAANGVIVLPTSDGGYFETVAGEALKVTTGAGSTTGIQVAYTLVSA